MQVSSYGINPLFIPGLEQFINSFVGGTVLQPFTYPDGFVLKLDPRADGALEELPEGLLTVVIKEAVNVPRMDFFGGADPYVKCARRGLAQKEGGRGGRGRGRASIARAGPPLHA